MRPELGDEAALERARNQLALSRSEWVAQMRDSRSPFDGSRTSPTEGGLGDVLRQWWHRHPLKLALDVITPMLRQQARKHPAGLLALAALAGATLVLLRPWRVLPLAGWVTLRSVPLDAWLAALRQVLDPGSKGQSDRQPPSP
jgi:hypothetical protein